MNNFKELACTFPTMPLLGQLRENGHLWNENMIRTGAKNSPHRESEDILIHFENIRDGHFEFYHSIKHLTAVHDMVVALAATIEPDEGKRRIMEFGRIVITKLPALGVIFKHTDLPEHTSKWDRYHMGLTGSATFYCGDEELIERPGQVFWFDNSKPHWVKNSCSTRIHLIVDVKK